MALNLTHVESLSTNHIRVWFDLSVVISDESRDKNNYSIISEDNTPLEIIEVINNSNLVSEYIALYVRNQVEGKIYTITVNNLYNRAGDTLIGNTVSWKHKRTKIDSFNASLPRVYDKRPISYLGQLGVAISYSDNIIGGSPSDITDVVEIEVD